MHHVLRRSNFAAAAAILLFTACGSPSGESVNEHCSEQDVHALTPAKDYVVRVSTADTGGVDECGIEPSRLVGAKVAINGASSRLTSIGIPEVSTTFAPVFGGLFQGELACNHGKLTSVAGFSDPAHRCEYWLFQEIGVTVIGRDSIALQVFVQKSDHQGCSPSGPACKSLFVMQLERP